MSKRFGRNQKRALRAQLAECRGQLRKSQETCQALRQQMSENEQCVRDVGQILGKHFAGLPPQFVRAMNIHPDMYLPACGASTDDPQVRSVRYHLMLLTKYQGARRDELSEMLHCRFITPAGDMAYGINEEAFRRMPSEVLQSRLCNEIAAEMAVAVVERRNQGAQR